MSRFTKLLLVLVLLTMPAAASSLPDEYNGRWGPYDCKAAEPLENGAINVTGDSVWLSSGARCRVLSVNSTHPGWHTDTVALACSKGVGRSKEIWHKQEIDGQDYLAIVQLSREGEERNDGPSMIILRKCQ
jgi:hypothetical protein